MCNFLSFLFTEFPQVKIIFIFNVTQTKIKTQSKFLEPFRNFFSQSYEPFLKIIIIQYFTMYTSEVKTLRNNFDCSTTTWHIIITI